MSIIMCDAYRSGLKVFHPSDANIWVTLFDDPAGGCFTWGNVASFHLGAVYWIPRAYVGPFAVGVKLGAESRAAGVKSSLRTIYALLGTLGVLSGVSLPFACVARIPPWDRCNASEHSTQINVPSNFD